MAYVQLIPTGYHFFGLVVLCLLSVSFYFRKRRGLLPLPPGPKPLPIVGNVFDAPRKRAWLEYSKWAKHYDSDILFAQLLFQPAVVVDSVEIARDLMEKRSNIYSDKLNTAMDELVGWEWLVANARYSHRWRQGRRYFHQYFHSGAIHKYRDVQAREVRAYLLRELEASGKVTTIHSINHLFSAIILDIIYGIQIKGMDDPMIGIIQEAAESFAEIKVPGTFWVDFFPFLKHLPSWVPGTTFHKYAVGHRPISDAMRTEGFDKVKPDILRGVAKPSVTNSLLKKLQDQYGDSNMYAEHEEYVKDATGTAYGAAVETSYSTTCWFILAMAMYPHVQAKAQRKLDSVIGADRLPTHEDLKLLPYMQAIILESLRWMPTLPMGIPHRVMVEDEYRGYRIPEGSLIIPNVWDMSQNANDYPNPDVFDPDRFLKDGGVNPEVRDPSEFVFGFGRRICPGRHFAKESLFLTFASILSVFNVRPGMGEDGKPVQLSVEAALTGDGLFLHPDRLECVFEPRSARAIELCKQPQAEQ